MPANAEPLQQVSVRPIAKTVSRIGFGCASLGSRVSRAQGERALAQAFELGVSWYDVAPSYGDGNAEEILGGFVAPRRDAIALCTKVGIRPAKPSPLAMLKPALRAGLQVFPGLRSRVTRLRPKAERVPLTPEMIHASIAESLRRLKTDYVDVLALHEPTPDECRDSALLDALSEVMRKGLARTVGAAGSPEAARAASERPDVFGVLQFASNPLERNLAGFRAGRDGAPQFLVAHSVLNRTALERLSRSPALADTGSGGGVPASERAAAALLDYALASNPGGLVLASMFDPAHLRFNVERARREPDPGIVQQVDSMLAQTG